MAKVTKNNNISFVFYHVVIVTFSCFHFSISKCKIIFEGYFCVCIYTRQHYISFDTVFRLKFNVFFFEVCMHVDLLTLQQRLAKTRKKIIRSWWWRSEGIYVLNFGLVLSTVHKKSNMDGHGKASTAKNVVYDVENQNRMNWRLNKPSTNCEAHLGVQLLEKERARKYINCSYWWRDSVDAFRRAICWARSLAYGLHVRIWETHVF